jgi:mRNA-degrading endonuclease RelE of RelBE toxin-antitoxin system
MMNEIVFTDQAQNDINNLSKFIKSQVKEAIKRIAIDPVTEGFELYRDLKGLWS